MESDKRITSRRLFNAACSGEKTRRPPVWVMRQAGRYLPEYRRLKQKHSFLEIVKTPELAVEATLQPIERFGFDCAILFSDILVVCEALGVEYDFREGGGITLSKKIRTLRDAEELDASADNVRSKLKYVADALKILRARLPDTALLGFCGSPFTLGAYMVEGGSGTDFSEYSQFARKNRGAFDALMGKLTIAVREYVKMQCECGVDAVQIFDSHAALAPAGEYGVLSGNLNREIARTARSAGTGAKVILYANSMTSRLEELLCAGADAYSLSSQIRLSEAAKLCGGAALQGNLDPASLSEDSPKSVAEKTRRIVSDMAPIGGHIFNLGHGIRPDAKIENVEAMCSAIFEFENCHNE